MLNVSPGGKQSKGGTNIWFSNWRLHFLVFKYLCNICYLFEKVRGRREESCFCLEQKLKGGGKKTYYGFDSFIKVTDSTRISLYLYLQSQSTMFKTKCLHVLKCHNLIKTVRLFLNITQSSPFVSRLWFENAFLYSEGKTHVWDYDKKKLLTN